MDSVANLTTMCSEQPDGNILVMGVYRHFMATGRVAMFNPNLLGIDKDQTITVNGQEYFLSLRKALKAKPGYTLVTADYCQLELRILAALAEEKELIEVFNRGEDPFRLIATKFHGREEVSDAERNGVKQVIYSIIYGVGISSLKENLGFRTDEETIKFKEDFGGRFPRLLPFVENCKREARELGYITTLFNRHRYLPNINSQDNKLRSADERKAVNSKIQGSASDLVKHTMLRIDRAIQRDKIPCELLLQVHDELIFQVADDFVDIFGKKLVEIMREEGRVLKTKLNVKLKTGPSWSECVQKIIDD